MEKTYKILKLVLLVLCMAAIFLGAGLLYKNLGSQLQMESLATQPAATAAPDQGETPEGTEAAETPAPDFTAYDREGNACKLSDFRGKPVILNFWASWCGPCQMEMPDFQQMYEQYGQQVQFLMVNLTDGQQETVETASEFIDQNGYSFPVYYDTAVEAAMAYGVSAVPVTYFLDGEGYLVAWGQGALNADTLQKGIDMLLENE